MEGARDGRGAIAPAQRDAEDSSRYAARKDAQGVRQPSKFVVLTSSPMKPRLTNPIYEIAVSADMKLQPNIGSDRSWVWKVAADYSEDPPTAETLAIRFANADCWYTPSLLSRV
jgi:hypothetical protein